MTSYNSNPKAYINGVEVTNSTLENATATLGRNEIFNQPRPSYGIIQLVTYNGAAPIIELTDKIEVKLPLANTNYSTVFTGWVTDIVTAVEAYGSVGNTIITTITASGGSHKAARALAGSTGYAQEYDGTRIENILYDALTYTWQDYLPNTAWNVQDPTLTWATIDPYVGVIDQPGNYELVAYSSGTTNALSLAQEAASSGLGFLHDRGDGRIYYNDSDSRINYVGEFGFLELPKNVILASNLQATESINDIINQISLTYASGTETAQDNDSIIDYGIAAASISTQLFQQAQAAAQAATYLSLQKLPYKNVTSIGIELSNSAMTDSLRNSLIGVYPSLPVRIEDLPVAISATDFDGFVEGYTWRLTRTQARLDLIVSNLRYSTESQQWEDVYVGDLWNTIDATITWQEAWVV